MYVLYGFSKKENITELQRLGALPVISEAKIINLSVG